MVDACLKNICSANDNIGENVFVGLCCKNDKVSVSFPLGFNLDNDEKSLRKDVLLLLHVLANNTDQKCSEIDSGSGEIVSDFPLRSYLYVISDYCARGYYKEREIILKTAKKGNIDWNRTIKTKKPYVQDDEVVFIDYIVRKNNISEDEFITLIHEWCVYESFKKVGWLFTTFVSTEPRIKFSKKRFINVINKKLSETNNDRNKQLFLHMLEVVNSMGESGSKIDFMFGTYRFEYVWEKMIDKAFGIPNKKDYYPTTRWLLQDEDHKNEFLEPDTIMIPKDENIFILDSKYYKYGDTAISSDLPGSSSITKQIAYGEYAYQEFVEKIKSNKVVYNAFIMPFNSSFNRFNSKSEMMYIGDAISDWKSVDGLQPYERIAGVLVDVKSIMRNYSKDYSRIERLASLIEEKID